MTSEDGSAPDLVATRPEQRTSENNKDAPVRGRWYAVRNGHGDDGDDDVEESSDDELIRQIKEESDVSTKEGGWLGCVTHVGSNYVQIEGPADNGSTYVTRIHYDNFWKRCVLVEDPDPIIDGKILHYQAETRRLMQEVRAVTAKLGVAPRHEITEGDSEVKAISIRSSEPVEAYKKALVTAKDKTLPDLFKQIEASNEMMSTWMKAKIIPLKAEAEALTDTVDLVKDRIFNVELYAGLVEKVVRVRDGAAADNDAQVHLMQRRAYMDEECLVGYEVGGMDYKNIEDFEKWLCKPANFQRLLPYPKTVVAFQIRRDRKDREANSLSDYIQVMAEEAADKWTYLYVRNGEQLHRIRTEIEFEEQLFPDTNNKIFTSSKLWATRFLHGEIRDLISDDEFQSKVEAYEEHLKKLKKIPEKDHWRHRQENPHSTYQPFTPDNVYYDDIMEIIQKEKKKHNRLVLVMQGLLDRSPVLHPHPPWQLWTGEGFAAAFKLIYDGTRAISAGPKPDFEVYRAQLNRFLRTGSITVGQEKSWLIREAEKANRKRYASRYRHESDRDYRFYKPSGDPGPGTLARVDSYSEAKRACTYKWKRKGQMTRYTIEEKMVPSSLTTGEENVLNVDAYTPGDFHLFFDDPRTRAEYIRWAWLLLEAEECHAGNRDLKPARALPAIAARPLRIRDPEEKARPADLSFQERKKQPPVEKKFNGKKAILDYNLQTRGGTKFKAGEIVTLSGYYRKTVTLKSTNGDKRFIMGVHIRKITLIE